MLPPAYEPTTLLSQQPMLAIATGSDAGTNGGGSSAAYASGSVRNSTVTWHPGPKRGAASRSVIALASAAVRGNPTGAQPKSW